MFMRCKRRMAVISEEGLWMRPFGSHVDLDLARRWSLLVLGLILWTPAEAHGPDGKGSASYEAYESGDFPAEYRGLENPLQATDTNATAGMRLYQDNCVMCHGANAEGNGHMAQMLEVKPANLRLMLRHFSSLDDYYYWIISEGGQRFGLPMPGFQEYLSDTQIWQLVTWMQDGFSGTGTDIEDRMHHQDDRMHDGDHMPGHNMGGSG